MPRIGGAFPLPVDISPSLKFTEEHPARFELPKVRADCPAAGVIECPHTAVPAPTGEVSDGVRTISGDYEHRMRFAAFCSTAGLLDRQCAAQRAPGGIPATAVEQFHPNSSHHATTRTSSSSPCQRFNHVRRQRSAG